MMPSWTLETYLIAAGFPSGGTQPTRGKGFTRSQCALSIQLAISLWWASGEDAVVVRRRDSEAASQYRLNDATRRFVRETRATPANRYGRGDLRHLSNDEPECHGG